MHILCILAEIYHFVLNYTFHKVRDDSRHFASLLVVLGNALRLFQVLKRECLDELQRNSTSFDKSSNHINHVEADL
jgi:hypothetical protein